MADLKLFENSRDYETFSAGDTIFAQGDPGDSMYVVLEGEVDIQVGGKTLDHLTPGDIFGEMAIVDAHPRSGTAVAATDCRVTAIDQKRFQFLVQHNPYFAVQVMSTMAHRLRRHMGVDASLL
jgi:CRP-like cAMP-binding protein